MEKYLSGRIIRGVGGNYDILLDSPIENENGGLTDTLSCRARGLFRHDGETPLVGDRIKLRLDTAENVMISDIYDRKNSLIRPPMANLDVLFVMFAVKKPEPSLMTVDKLISIAENKKIEPVIIITKADLDPEKAEKLAAIYKKSGFTVMIQGEGYGCNELYDYICKNLDNKVAAFAGASGIGKSTLLNRIFPDLMLETGEISRKIARGKHTTRCVSLYSVKTQGTIGHGFIADTPGFGLLDFERFDFFTNDELVYTYREFAEHIGKCRYTKCSHTKEDGCSIIEAVNRGDIPKERHESFVEIRNVLKNKHDWDKK
ncbi:MAG: ribosome small subunit-dependent GTPase A [Ruminococcaceae bacterium]|nr:ribosome small subunit-dependent GTPase A [Oscillospiraceae bacterium]